MEEEIMRWMARRKSALVLEIIQDKVTVSEASRQFDLTPSEVESWVDDGKRGMENALRAKPEDVREQYERQLKDRQEAYGNAILELRAKKKCRPCWARTRLVVLLQQGLREDGFEVSMVKLCRWLGMARRTVYYGPTKAAPVVRPERAEPIKALIEAEPSFGYRTVAGLQGMNKNTVQRIFQLMAGRCVSAPWADVLGSRRFRRSRKPRMSVGWRDYPATIPTCQPRRRGARCLPQTNEDPARSRIWRS
nr:DUF1153 domain-containing protein [Lysobacter sp. H23M47]